MDGALDLVIPIFLNGHMFFLYLGKAGFLSKNCIKKPHQDKRLVKSALSVQLVIGK